MKQLPYDQIHGTNNFGDHLKTTRLVTPENKRK